MVLGSWFSPILSLWTEGRIGIALGVLSIVVTIGITIWVGYKSRLRQDIVVLLKRCRDSEEWDDRSELKLFQWMLETPEDEIHTCGLRLLRRIRNSLRDYHYIHVYGHDPVAPPGRLERTLQGFADRIRYRRERRVRNAKPSRKRRRLARK